MLEFTRSVELPVSQSEAFRWHARPGALQRLSPPWDPVEVVAESGTIEAGTRVTLRLKAGPLPARMTWEAVHTRYEPPHLFQDRQEKGPFAFWEHTHIFHRLGLGGPMGDGSQYMSWIGIDDVIGAIYWAMGCQDLEGPVNLVAPAPVTNAEFTAVLARVLGRPARLRVPAAAIRMLYGQMGREIVLASTRVLPEKLLASGYRFRHPDLEDVLRHLLGKPLTQF